MSAVLAATIGRVAGEKAYLFRLPEDVKKAQAVAISDQQRNALKPMLERLQAKQDINK